MTSNNERANTLDWRAFLGNKLVRLNLLWLLALGVYFFAQSILGWGMPDGDVKLYHSLALKWLDGGLPFIDFFFEYPPASIFMFVIPALISRDVQQYIMYYQVLSWATLWCSSLLMLKLHSILDIKSISRAQFFLYTSVASWVVMVLALNRFDTFSAFFALAGLVLFMQGIKSQSINYRSLGIIIVLLGTLIKLYPMFLLPFFGLYEIKNYHFQAILRHTLWSG
jgi:hypothetical protein